MSGPNPVKMDVLQQAVTAWAEEAFPRSTFEKKRAHLTEEILELWGFNTAQVELFLKEIGTYTTPKLTLVEIAEELSDIQIVLFHLASSAGVWLADAVADKHKINLTRKPNETAEAAGHVKLGKPGSQS